MYRVSNLAVLHDSSEFIENSGYFAASTAARRSPPRRAECNFFRATPVRGVVLPTAPSRSRHWQQRVTMSRVRRNSSVLEPIRARSPVEMQMAEFLRIRPSAGFRDDYHSFGFKNQHQRLNLESKLRFQFPSFHSSVALRQFSGTCGYG